MEIIFRIHTSREQGEARVKELLWLGRYRECGRLKSGASRRETIIEVDIPTGETYMLFKSYICAMEVKG